MKKRVLVPLVGILFFVLLAGALSDCARRKGHGGPVIVIGLDGATWDLLQPWIDAGDLPTLAQVQHSWAWGKLRSSSPYLSPSAWTTAVTGVNPGKHAIFDFQRRLPGQKAVVNETAASRRAQPVWNVLKTAGMRSLLLNIPMTDPPDDMGDGMCIAGFPHLDQVGYTYPPELQDKLPGYFLEHMELSLVPGKEDSLLASYKQGLQMRTRILLDWLTHERFDLLWAVFTETDRIQHTFWIFMDPEHPGYDAGQGARYGRAIHDYWVAQDRALGEILSKVGASATVLLLSDHGFAPLRYHLQLGNLLQAPGSPLTKDEARAVYSFDDADACRIYIARRGREPNVPWTAEDANRIRDKLVGLLRSTVDPRTGRPVCAEVHTGEELFTGTYAEKGPDIVVVPSPGYILVGGTPGGSPDSVIVPHTVGITAWHEMNGIYALRGPAIVPGRKDGDAGGPFALLDIVPTVLYLLNQPIPEGLDGKVLSPLIDPGYLSGHPVRTTGPLEEDFRELSPEDMKNLKNLPYIGD